MSLVLTTLAPPPRVFLWTIFLSFSFPTHLPLCLMSLPLLRPVSLFLIHHRYHPLLLPPPLPQPRHHPLRSVGLSLLFLFTTLAALVLRMSLRTRLPLPERLLPHLPRFTTFVLGLSPHLIAILLTGTVSLPLLSPLPIGLP